METAAQNFYPYDAILLGLNGMYQIIGDNSFFINAPRFILSKDNIITRGREYILFDTSKEIGIKVSDVILDDAYYHEGIIHLIVRDIRSNRLFTISQCLECPENDCPWILIDLNYFQYLMDTKAIRDYCGCDDNLKRPNHGSTLKLNEDLLDFDF